MLASGKPINAIVLHSNRQNQPGADRAATSHCAIIPALHRRTVIVHVGRAGVPDMLPLEGVRVLDLSRYSAGPFCTRMLADYGADVIKIEDPRGGDPARNIGPFFHDEPDPEKSGLFLFLNTSKRSVTIDIKTKRGRDLIKALVRSADVLIEGFSPGTMDSLGLGYEALAAENPRLVMTSITNFGQTGPYRDWQVTDLTLYAMAGDMWGSGDPDLEPVKTAGRMATFHVGYAAALATSVALHSASAKGKGHWVDLSAYEATSQSIDFRLLKLMGYQHSKQVSKRLSPAATLGLANGIYPCSDGLFAFNVLPLAFPALLKMIGHEELLEEPAWATIPARARPDAAEEFDAYLIPWTIEHTRKEVQQAAMDHGVLGAPLNTMDGLLEDDHFRERSFFQTIDHPATGPIEYPGYNFDLYTGDDKPMPPRRPAPTLGQHTTEVMSVLGYDGEAIARLRSQGVV
jgi:crotonobetainyl-CoA:carnitine CoA-transferase CaiB-like acyl-CoA transferase